MNEWAKANASRLREYRAKWGKDNPDKLRKHQAKYRKANRDKKRASATKWYKEHPDKACEKSARRRAAKLGVGSEKVQRYLVYERDNGICHICGQKTNPIDWHLDHIIPLCRGGEHSYKNVAVSHPKCNMRKGAA